MSVTLRSFAKINLGLVIGPRRRDGFHQLSTIYHTLGLHDLVTLEAGRGTGIQITCNHPRVPLGRENTCYQMAQRWLRLLGLKRRVVIRIRKRLPVAGGLGAASSNAAATLFALERELKIKPEPAETLRLAARVGSDVPLFLLGGAVLGLGRGEEVYPLPDLPPVACVVVTPPVAVSTPAAFAAWDARARQAARRRKLTSAPPSDRINVLSRAFGAWLAGTPTGVPATAGRNRAEALLLDLVRTGIENDFEQVVFSRHPELRDLKHSLEREGASYASLSGSGSSVYGLFADAGAARRAAARLKQRGVAAQLTALLPRRQYWKRLAAQ